MVSSVFSPSTSFGEKCALSLLALCMLSMVVFLGLSGLGVINSENLPSTGTAITVVEQKEIIPAYTTMLPGSSHQPESYLIKFKIEGKEKSFAPEKELFDGINPGDKIEVDYGHGRLTGSDKPIRIRLLNKK